MADKKPIVKVLIAEDDPPIAEFFVKCIEALGYAAVCCRDGEQALHLLEDNLKFDLLVTDITMPKMDGRELVSVLRSREKFMDLPIVIVSGVVGVNEISTLLDSGVTHFMGKPVKRKELQDCVKELVEYGSTIMSNR